MRKPITFIIIAAMLLALCSCGTTIIEADVDPVLPLNPQPSENIEPIVSDTNAVTEDVLADYVETFAKNYPGIIKKESIGKTAQGRDITLIKLGTGDTEVLAVAEFHACEHISSLYLLSCIEDYAEAYYSEDGMMGGYSVKELLSKYTIYAVPCCNPDGAYLMWNGGETLCTDDESKLMMKANGNGVDLNRNFPFMWDDVDTEVYEPSERYYKGDSAGSENETKALMELCSKHDFQFMLSFHSQGRCVFWRDDTNGVIEGDERLVNAICDVTGFKAQPVSEGNAAYGGFENWFRSEYGKPGFCVELVDVEVKSDTTLTNIENFEDEVDYEETSLILLEAMKTTQPKTIK